MTYLEQMPLPVSRPKGLDDAPIKDVRLTGITVTHAREPLLLRNIGPLRLQSVRVNGILLPEQPPMTPRDVPRLKIKM